MRSLSEMPNSVDWEASVLLAGMPRSGKSWLGHRLVHGVVPERVTIPPFLGCDLRAAVVRLGQGVGDVCAVGRVRIWEPSGIARDQAMNGFLSSSAAVVVCISVSYHGSPKHACEQLAIISTAMRPGTVLTVCGTQADVLDYQDSAAMAVVSELRAIAFRFGAEFILCSAVTGEGVEDVFCGALAACYEAGGLQPRKEPILSHAAGVFNQRLGLPAGYQAATRRVDGASGNQVDSVAVPGVLR